MEKGTPHHKLSIVKSLIKDDHVQVTNAARRGATALGFGFDDMLAVILALDSADFYKSMTTYLNHQIWQDVYRSMTPAGEVYLKLTIIDDVLIVSFKEL